MSGHLWRAASGRAVGRKSGWIMGGLVGAWLVLVGGGTMSMVIYDSTGGTRASAPAQWPSGTTIQSSPSQAAVVLFLHPRCPCGKATLNEFEAAAQACPDAAKSIVFFEPEGAGTEWADSAIMRRAALIPDVRILRDQRGVEARRFGVATSGEVLAYDAAGRLIFEGGLTVGRGVEGESLARRTLVDAVRGRAKTMTDSPVYGCAIFDRAPDCAAPAEEPR